MRRKTTLAVFAVLALVAAACSSGGEATTHTNGSTGWGGCDSEKPVVSTLTSKEEK